jgi:hypothetical protein
MPSAFIDDGYTLTATLPGKEGEYDACEITYRPLVRLEHFKYSTQVQKWFDKETIKREHLGDLDQLYADMFAGSNGWTPKLLKWDMKDSRGDVVAITSENLLRIHPGMFADMIDVFFPTGEEEAEKN